MIAPAGGPGVIALSASDLVEHHFDDPMTALERLMGQVMTVSGIGLSFLDGQKAKIINVPADHFGDHFVICRADRITERPGLSREQTRI